MHSAHYGSYKASFCLSEVDTASTDVKPELPEREIPGPWHNPTYAGKDDIPMFPNEDNKHKQTNGVAPVAAEEPVLFDDPMYATPEPKKLSVKQNSHTTVPLMENHHARNDEQGPPLNHEYTYVQNLPSSQFQGSQEYSCIDDPLVPQSTDPLSHEYAEVLTLKKANAISNLPPIAFEHYEMSFSSPRSNPQYESEHDQD